MKELKPGDKVKVRGIGTVGSSYAPIRFDGESGEVMATREFDIPGWIRVKTEHYPDSFVHECQVEKIEPEKCGNKFVPSWSATCGLEKGHSGMCVCPEPEEPAPKPGDMDYAGHYFRSKEGWAGPSRFYAGPRRKPSTDPRYVALCALEQLPDPIDQGHCSILRSRLRSHPFQVSTSKGRNPHAAPRRKDDRRG